MVIRMDTKDGVMTVWLTGELDHHAARPLRERVDSALLQSGVSELHLDFSGVTFMDSSGIGLIMGRYRQMAGRGGKLRVTGASERLLRVMKLAGLERLPVWETSQKQTQKEARS